MPNWLTILLAVWGALAPVVWGVWRAVGQLVTKIERVEQWFDDDSELARQVGTVPTQLRRLHDDLAGLRGTCLPGLKQRVDQLERRLADG